MVNCPLAAEIISLVWGTPGNFDGFRVLAVLLHGTLVVGVSQTAAFNRGRYLYSAWAAITLGINPHFKFLLVNACFRCVRLCFCITATIDIDTTDIAHVYCCQMAVWIKMPFDMEVGVGPGDVVLDGDPALSQKVHSPHFRPMSVVAKRSPISAAAEHWLF